MKITDLTIDPKSLGEKLWLVDVMPAYAYKNGERTDTVTGHRYSIAMPERHMEKINVRIDGKQLMDAPEGYVEVKFTGLEIFVYFSNGQPQVGAKATAIALANAKT
jgi:hypothetical protein